MFVKGDTAPAAGVTYRFLAMSGGTLDWIAAALIIAATALFSTSNLLWTIREGVPPLSANSEFFAYSWIYAIRWGAGEPHVFQPHSQLIFPVYALINDIFEMTTGGTDHILSGWRRISLIWPIVLTVASLALLFSTASRRAPIVDVMLAAALYLLAVPLFLSDHALNSLSYHSLAIPLALAALPLWRFYGDNQAPSWRFYALLGIYTAACALGKPTFLAFATPFYAMEFVRAARSWRSGGLLFSGLLAVAIYLLWLLAFCRGLEGLSYQISKTYEFMRSQAGMYQDAKGATLFHWYAGYVIGVMGPLPSLIILTIAGMVLLCRDRLMIAIGVIAGISSALFCLYARTQLHAQPEFIGLLLALAVGVTRTAQVPEMIELGAASYARLITPVAGIAAVALASYAIISPPEMRLRGFAEFMGQFDAISIPSLFDNPPGTRTIALETYPLLFWGAGDAWCRGSIDVFGGNRSPLLDKAFGNVTCMVERENDAVDWSHYDRVVFPKEITTPMEATLATILTHFPNVASRFIGCHKLDTEKIPTFEIVECNLKPLPRRNS